MKRRLVSMAVGLAVCVAMAGCRDSRLLTLVLGDNEEVTDRSHDESTGHNTTTTTTETKESRTTTNVYTNR